MRFTAGAAAVLSVQILVIFSDGASSVATVLDPKHRAVDVGATVVLRCAGESANDIMRWHYYAPFQSKEAVIYNGKGGVSKDFPRCTVDRDDLTFTLVITGVQLDDAGTYICFNSDSGLKSAAALIVISKKPTCKCKLVGAEGQNTVTEIACSVDYAGVWKPTFDCLPRTPQAQITIDHPTSTSVTQRQRDPGPGIQFQNATTCIMLFNRSDLRVVLSSETYSTGVPTYKWNSTTPCGMTEDGTTDHLMPIWAYALIGVVAFVCLTQLILFAVHLSRKKERRSSGETEGRTQNSPQTRASAVDNAYTFLQIPSTSQTSQQNEQKSLYSALNKQKVATAPACQTRVLNHDSYPNDYIEVDVVRSQLT